MRSVAPYIHAFRNKTFVVGFGGEVVHQGLLNALVSDIALLQAMGIQIVLVHGSRPQVEEQMSLHGVESEFSHGMRITDARALESAKEAAGEVRLDIEAAISQGLPNTPMAHAHISVVSGNFVTARPVGILDGVDFAAHRRGAQDRRAIRSAIRSRAASWCCSRRSASRPPARHSICRWKTWPRRRPSRCAPTRSCS